MRLVLTSGDFQVLETRDDYVIKRAHGVYEQHGHIHKGRGKNKGFKTCKHLLLLTEKGLLAESKYLRECQRRILTEDEFEHLREPKKKLMYYNRGGRKA